MKLYLIRHAVAYDHGDPAYPNDDDRPLTPKGRRQFREAAKGLVELIGAPGLILTSPLPRAAQTANIIAKTLDGAVRVEETTALLPSGTPENLAAECRVRFDATSEDANTKRIVEHGLALVGHAPSIDQLASWLLSGGTIRPIVALRKGGAACINFVGVPEAGVGTLDWVLTRGMLRRLAH